MKPLAGQGAGRVGARALRNGRWGQRLAARLPAPSARPRDVASLGFRQRRLLLLAALCGWVGPGTVRAERSADGASAAPTRRARIVSRYPHDTGAFTQGLIYRDGLLYEGTGLHGRSSLREVELATGRVLRKRRLARRLFGEGIAGWRDTIVQLTWRAGTGLIYDARTLELRDTFRYEGEGWGITHDGRHWFVSDGSARLRLFDPVSREQVGTIAVRDHGQPLQRLNELEYVDGEIWANIWHEDRLARIEPTSGQVLGYIDLAHLWPAERRGSGADVLNGIAHDAQTGRLFVTGKFWPHVFEIALAGTDAP